MRAWRMSLERTCFMQLLSGKRLGWAGCPAVSAGPPVHRWGTTCAAPRHHLHHLALQQHGRKQGQASACA